MRAPAPSHWSDIAERGSGLGMRALFICQRLLGQRVTRWCLYPVVFYYFLLARAARAASRQYLERLKAHAMPQLETGWRASFRHMYAFAVSGLDKFAAWGGRYDEARISFPNQALFETLRLSGRGAVLIGAHLGNLEMTRAMASSKQRATVNAVVYTRHAQRFNRILAHANADFAANLIQVSSLGPDTAILLKEKVDRGELLVIVGDRTPPTDNGRTVEADFLGARAPFAIGPWVLASLLECPVYLFFCLPKADGGDGYCIHFEPFATRIDLPRKDRMQHVQVLVQRYADRLAHYCVQAPLQWFNFFDFWRSDSAARQPVEP